MDQIIGEREAEKNITDRIQKQYHLDILHEGQDRRIVFTVQDDGFRDPEAGSVLSGLELTPCTAAMRRNLPSADKRHIPSMADIERVQTNLISTAVRGEDCRQKGMGRLLAGALAYQNQVQTPFCLVESPEGTFDDMSTADLFGRYGFQYIYDRPHYGLNTNIISPGLLGRAAAGETVCLEMPGTTLQAAKQEDMLPLAHFANSRLCRQYGLFIIRTASYYENVVKRLQSHGGHLFQIMEDGVRKGCFAYTGHSDDSVRDAIFDKESDRARYLTMNGEKKPAVMARIVNLPGMLRHIPGKGKVTIAIRIKDPVIAENDGLFLWYIDAAGSRIERIEQSAAGRETDASMRPELTVTIGEFAAFLFEYMQLKQNAKFDSIYMAGPAWVDGI